MKALTVNLAHTVFAYLLAAGAVWAFRRICMTLNDLATGRPYRKLRLEDYLRERACRASADRPSVFGCPPPYSAGYDAAEARLLTETVTAAKARQAAVNYHGMYVAALLKKRGCPC